jgi:putative peptidoglycan lipid II flippase
MIYAFGLVTFSLEVLFVHSFFALSDTKTPVKYGILCVFLDILLAIALLRPLGYLGIAAAYVISKTVKIILLGILLNKKLKGLFSLQIITFFSKLAVTTCAVWMSVAILLGNENSESFFHTFSYDLMLPGIGALVTFTACSYLLRIDEFRALVSLLRHRKAGVSALYEEFK